MHGASRKPGASLYTRKRLCLCLSHAPRPCGFIPPAFTASSRGRSRAPVHMQSWRPPRVRSDFMGNTAYVELKPELV
jgi:hypothetical protein